jgi:hypothetical protein
VVDLSQSFFDPSNSANRKSLLPLQVGNLQGPVPAGFTSASGLLLPDQVIDERLKTFPDDLYNLNDSSHLTRFMHALLGDAGAGQLRKRQLISRLTDALTSTHFFDLDRFYGAIFGAQRVNDALFGNDPVITPATPDEWDELYAADARFRESILALAKAIAMGATPAGVRAAAEAVLGAPVQLYEDWQLLDPLGRNDVGSDTQSDTPGARTWAQITAAYATWSLMDHTLWGNLSYPGSIVAIYELWGNIGTDFGPNYADIEADQDTYGILQNVGAGSPVTPTIPYGDRFGFHIVPLKKYDDPDDSVNLTTKSGDVFQIQRVLERLKPAGALMTVDPTGLEIVNQVTIANVASPSSYWEIDYKVVPKGNNTALYPVSNAQAAAGIKPTDAHTPPRYAWQGSQATEWHYNGEIVGVVAYVEDENHTVTDSHNFQTIVYYDGTRVNYTADKGIMDSTRAWGAINAKALSASPYAGAR